MADINSKLSLKRERDGGMKIKPIVRLNKIDQNGVIRRPDLLFKKRIKYEKAPPHGLEDYFAGKEGSVRDAFEDMEVIGETPVGSLYRLKHKLTQKTFVMEEISHPLKIDKYRDVHPSEMPIPTGQIGRREETYGSLKCLLLFYSYRGPTIGYIDKFLDTNHLQYLVRFLIATEIKLFDYIKRFKDMGKKISCFTIKCIMRQLCVIIHQRRDILYKPGRDIKLNDEDELIVVTPFWYIAPEAGKEDPNNSLACNAYNANMWFVGCIFAQLLFCEALSPLNDKEEELHSVFRLFGASGEQVGQWVSQGSELPEFHKLSPNLPNLCCESMDLLLKLLQYDPIKRISAPNALAHPYFSISSSDCQEE